MTYYADLTPYNYLLIEPDGVNVGWLEPPNPFAAGDVPREFVTKLERLVVHGTVHQTRGYHFCLFCRRPGMVPLRVGWATHHLGSSEIRVMGRGVTYFAPDMIVHYVTAHRYQPPAPFVAAVLESKILESEMGLLLSLLCGIGRIPGLGILLQVLGALSMIGGMAVMFSWFRDFAWFRDSFGASGIATRIGVGTVLIMLAAIFLYAARPSDLFFLEASDVIPRPKKWWEFWAESPALESAEGAQVPPLRRTALALAAILLFDLFLMGGTMFSLLIALLGALLLAALAILAVIQAEGRVALNRVVRAAMYVLLGIAAGGAADLHAEPAQARATRVIEACRSYKAKRGTFPERLQDLVPEFLPSIPRARYTLAWGQFTYRASKESHALMYVKSYSWFGRRLYSFETELWSQLD